MIPAFSRYDYEADAWGAFPRLNAERKDAAFIEAAGRLWCFGGGRYKNEFISLYSGV